MTRQATLFGDAPAPRATTRSDPRVHVCRSCGKPGASCGIGGDAWYCVPCAPGNFWPKGRRA